MKRPSFGQPQGLPLQGRAIYRTTSPRIIRCFRRGRACPCPPYRHPHPTETNFPSKKPVRPLRTQEFCLQKIRPPPAETNFPSKKPVRPLRTQIFLQKNPSAPCGNKFSFQKTRPHPTDELFPSKKPVRTLRTNYFRPKNPSAPYGASLTRNRLSVSFLAWSVVLPKVALPEKEPVR